jgi:primosomal protein N' (replication factor Y)
MTTSLFTDDASQTPSDASTLFAGVALERGIDRVLDYRIPPELSGLLHVGQRVRVPLGKNNKPARGYVVSIHPVAGVLKTKDVIAIEDSRTLLSAQMLKLACWMSRYYVTPLGMVLQSVIPSAVKKKTGLGRRHMVRLAKPREEIQALVEKSPSKKRRAILARLLLLEGDAPIELILLASESGSTPATVRKLAKLGLIRITDEPDLPGLTASLLDGTPDETDIKLNEDQQKVFDELAARLTTGFSVNLLHGVTGSGKTEVYLQCIRRIVESGRQALVLVPEIALTPQTVRRFQSRFPKVAILHSGLGATQRHRYWQQISTGGADVVVGARSAVFAPLPNLGIIVVDEEHDSSYKQDSAPRYHGRDVAIKRAQLESLPILLGSATPSLESYYRATSQLSASPPAPQSSVLSPQSYHYLSLPRRVLGLSMPIVELVDLREENKLRRGMHLIGLRLERLLRETLAEKHQAILLLNRRGYANFVYCPSCNEVVQCAYCDATMTYHRWAGQHVESGSFDKSLHTGSLHCHYCLAVNPLPPKCPACGKKLSLFGLGTQRVEEELKRLFPDLTYARVDSDTMRSGRDYESILGAFARREIQVMLGTQMIAKGLDYPNVTLVGVISGDTALALPDFRAGERTFQLITQVAGRAGRGSSAGRVVLQTFLPDDPAIGHALRHDYIGFAQTELKRRKESGGAGGIGLPPFSRMARIILRGEDDQALHGYAEQLAADLAGAIEKAAPGLVTMKGPMPCPINRIAGYWRQQIVLLSAKPQAIQRTLALARHGGRLTQAERVAVDVDPVSLL